MMQKVILSMYMSACLTFETVYQVAVKFSFWNPHSLKLLDKCNLVQNGPV